MLQFLNYFFFHEDGRITDTQNSFTVKASESGYNYLVSGNNIYFFEMATAYKELEKGFIPQPVKTVNYFNDKSFKEEIDKHCKEIKSKIACYEHLKRAKIYSRHLCQQGTF